MRSLIWIPIIHSPEDMGDLRDSVHDSDLAVEVRHIGTLT